MCFKYMDIDDGFFLFFEIIPDQFSTVQKTVLNSFLTGAVCEGLM